MVGGQVEIGGDEVEGVGILRCGDEWDKSSSSLENPERRRGQRDGFVGGIAGVVGEVVVPLGEHLEHGGGIPWASAWGGSWFGAFPVKRRPVVRRWSARRSME